MRRILASVCVSVSLLWSGGVVPPVQAHPVRHAQPVPVIPYQFTTVDLPIQVSIGGRPVPDLIRFTDVNTAGLLLGNDRGAEGFLVTLPQTVTEIRCPGDVTENDSTHVTALNNAGVVVGTCTVDWPQSRTVGFRRDVDGTFTLLTVPDAPWTIVQGINDAGVMVGQYSDGVGLGLQQYHGFLWEDGVITTIDAPFDGAFATALLGINNAGQVIGTAFHRRPGSPDINDYDSDVAFLYDHGVFTRLAVPGAQPPGACCGGTTFPLDLTNTGQVLGATYDAEGIPQFFLYTIETDTYALIGDVPRPILDSYDFSILHGASAWGINDRGLLAGTYVQVFPCAACGPSGGPGIRLERHGFLASPVAPTPAVALITQVRGDFNGDGWPDVAGVTADSHIVRCLARTSRCAPLPGRAVGLAASDFNGDGRTDLGAVAADTSLWRMVDGQTWQRVPGALTAMVAGDIGAGGARLVLGTATDSRLWTSPDLMTWTPLPYYLADIAAGDYRGTGQEQVVGVDHGTTIWLMDRGAAWSVLPGNLVTITTVPGIPDGMRGVAYDGIEWVAHTLGQWERVPEASLGPLASFTPPGR